MKQDLIKQAKEDKLQRQIDKSEKMIHSKYNHIKSIEKSRIHLKTIDKKLKNST